jgi:hypothetical protein
VGWNALAPQRWKRTIIYLRRALTRPAGLTVAQLHRERRVSYMKVAEYQARGALHLHVVVRLDGADPHSPPPGWAAPNCWPPDSARPPRRLRCRARWAGRRSAGASSPTSAPSAPGSGSCRSGRPPATSAKYTTKATEGLGAALDQPIRRAADLEQLALPAHVTRPGGAERHCLTRPSPPVARCAMHGRVAQPQRRRSGRQPRGQTENLFRARLPPRASTHEHGSGNPGRGKDCRRRSKTLSCSRG